MNIVYLSFGTVIRKSSFLDLPNRETALAKAIEKIR